MDTNRTNNVLHWVSYTGLVEIGAQISTIIKLFANALGLEICNLDGLLDIEETGGIEVPYEGYVEANLWIQEIRTYN